MKKFGAIMLVLGLLTTGLIIMPSSSAVDTSDDVNVSFDPNNYPTGVPSNWYAPGDSVTIRLQGDMITDGTEDVYDVVIWVSGASCFSPWADKIEYWDDVELDDNGEASIVFLGDDTKSLDDEFYDVEVIDNNYIESSGTVTECNTIGDPDFWIRQYQIETYTDMDGYVPGDEVKVFYSVFNIKDGSPADTVVTDMKGEWEFVSSDGKSDSDGSFDAASGTIDLAIDNQGDTAGWYILDIWVNGTSNGGDRELPNSPTGVWIDVGPLGVTVWYNDLTGGTVIPGDTMEVIVDVSSGFGGEPNIDVKITVLDGTGTSADEISGYGGDFVSDHNGQVRYIFKLGSQFEAGKTYTIKAVGDHPQSPQKDEDETTFDVKEATGTISVYPIFDKGTYLSGDSLLITVNTAVPLGHSNPNTYSLQIFPNGCGGSVMLFLDIKATKEFNWTVPNDYSGWLCFNIEVYNEEGDKGQAQVNRYISYGILAVNSAPEEYNAGDTITIQYSLKSNVMSNPTYFYRVLDANGNTVDANTTSGGSFTFAVPSAPSTGYLFRVYASDDGRTIQDEDESTLIFGYFLNIILDKEIYSRGETMKVQYEIILRGDSKTVGNYHFSYGLAGGPMDDFQTTSEKGEFTYYIPANMDEGTLIFDVDEITTGADAQEVITVRGYNPLWWSKLADIPAFDILLFLLIIVLFILFLMQRRKMKTMVPGGSAPAAAAPAGETAPPQTQTGPAMEASAGPSALSVPCRSCGTSIELTTSKRPIEVMCPSCGETQMVY